MNDDWLKYMTILMFFIGNYSQNRRLSLFLKFLVPPRITYVCYFYVFTLLIILFSAKSLLSNIKLTMA